MPNYDLHTHSTASDGAYSPSELLQQAALAGITHLALTDHDSTAGLNEARVAAEATGVRLIHGVEISVTWQGKSVHVVGLNIDPGCKALQAGLLRLQATRLQRAEEMGRRLDRWGLPGSLEAVLEMAGDGMITRFHIHDGQVDNIKVYKHVIRRDLRRSN